MRKFFPLVFICLYCTVATAQNVGIGTSTPLNKLHVAGGLRLDTLTGVNGNGIVTHDANGVIYGLKFSGNINDVLRGNGTFGSGGAGSVGWLLNGNSGTNPENNFLGTTDDASLVFKIRNLHSGLIDSAFANSSFGYRSLSQNTFGAGNNAFGFKALLSNTEGARNTAIGNEALSSNTLGNDNTAVGYNALLQNIGAGNIVEPIPFRGVRNTAVGSNSLSSNVVGSDNAAFGANAMRLSTSSQGSAFGVFALEKNSSFNASAFGYSALQNNTTGGYNSGFGSFALGKNSTGKNNTAIGVSALYENIIGNENTAVGYYSLEQNVNGYNNTSIGAGALQINRGYQNTAVGHHALNSNITGSDNVAIGVNANVTQPDLVRAIAIGANARVGASYSMVLGGTGFSAVNVGIGVEIPISTLHVRGSAKIFDGAANHTGNFWNGTSNLSGVEITSSGNDAYIGIQRANGAALHISKPFGSIGDMVAFFNSSVLVGRIYSDGVSTAYLTTSDSRLKENRRTTQYNLKTLMQIEAEDYNYVSDNTKTNLTGFIAQDLYKVFPQAVIPGGDDPRTNPWMIDYSKLTPLLVKAVQEQQQMIDDQNKKIDKQQQQIDLLIKEMQNLKKDLITQKN
jgi:hypothetical protein